MPDAPEATQPPPASDHVLSLATVCPTVRATQYAVRGEIVAHAARLAAQLATQPGSLPFSRVVLCNIGNPQQLGQQPLTFYRQVLALCEYPELLKTDFAAQHFPSDVLARARHFLERIPGGTGAYSESKGLLVCREAVARFISSRDSCPADPEHIFLTDGASPGVHYLMKTLLRSSADAVLVPIPQYPLYSATIALYGGTLLPYHLQEASGWGLDCGALRDSVAAARRAGRCVRALCVINPGNPTGNCLTPANQADIVRLCADEQLVLLADEVYQDNVYAAGKSFTSFRKVAHSLGLLGAFPLFSFHSISKGVTGECGRRGGYFEAVGCPPDVLEQLLKLASIGLCPNVSGQIVTALVAQPPAPGEPSFERFSAERREILASLARRAATLVAALNRMEGVSCNEAEGALYAFPRITIPARAVAAAAAAGQLPDFFYCWRLLEATGVTVVPGSGFGQQEGTWHFRTTFLPPEGEMESVCQLVAAFHQQFMDQFRD